MSVIGRILGKKNNTHNAGGNKIAKSTSKKSKNIFKKNIKKKVDDAEKRMNLKNFIESRKEKNERNNEFQELDLLILSLGQGHCFDKLNFQNDKSAKNVLKNPENFILTSREVKDDSGQLKGTLSGVENKYVKRKLTKAGLPVGKFERSSGNKIKIPLNKQNLQAFFANLPLDQKALEFKKTFSLDPLELAAYAIFAPEECATIPKDWQNVYSSALEKIKRVKSQEQELIPEEDPKIAFSESSETGVIIVGANHEEESFKALPPILLSNRSKPLSDGGESEDESKELGDLFSEPLPFEDVRNTLNPESGGEKPEIEDKKRKPRKLRRKPDSTIVSSQSSAALGVKELLHPTSQPDNEKHEKSKDLAEELSPLRQQLINRRNTRQLRPISVYGAPESGDEVLDMPRPSSPSIGSRGRLQSGSKDSDVPRPSSPSIGSRGRLQSGSKDSDVPRPSSPSIGSRGDNMQPRRSPKHRPSGSNFIFRPSFSITEISPQEEVLVIKNAQGEPIFSLTEADFYPTSKKNLLEGKQKIIRAAVTVFENNLPGKDNPKYDLYISFLGFLKKRLNQIDAEISRCGNEPGDLVQMYGQKAKKDLGPIKNDTELKANQKNALKIAVDAIKKEEEIFALETPYFHEHQLMWALIEQACQLPEEKSASFALKEVLTEQINQSPSHVIKKEINFPDAPQVNVVSVIKPAGHITNNPEILERIGKSSSLPKEHFNSYQNEDGTIGLVNCHDIASHINPKSAAHTEIVFEDGSVGFSGGRHGTTSAYGIEPGFLKARGVEFVTGLISDLVPENSSRLNPGVKAELEEWIGKKGLHITEHAKLVDFLAESAMKDTKLCEILRRQASLNAARELFILELVHSPNYEAYVEMAQQGEPIGLVSVGLITPGTVIKGKANEAEMLKVQAQAWQDLAQEIREGTFTVALVDPKTKEEVLVKNVEFLQSNFGVNKGAVDIKVGENHIDVDKASGWQLANVYNEKMIGRLNKKLEARNDKINNALKMAIPGSPEFLKLQKEQETLNALWGQIIEIWKTEAYKKVGNDPYKMAARIALLSYMLGDLVFFNCKSGKDRTGAMDVAVKYLAWCIRRYGEVPAYDAPNTEESVREKLNFYFHSGNFEWQKMLTGFPGYMVSTGVVQQLYLNEEECEIVKGIFFGICKYAPGY